MANKAKTEFLLESFLFEDDNEWGWEPSSPQRAPGSPPPLPKQGGEPPYQRKLHTNKPPQRDPPPYKADPMHDFKTSLVINTNNIAKVAGRLEDVEEPQAHFKAYKEVIAAVDNVFRDLAKASKLPKVQSVCGGMRDSLGTALVILNQATRTQTPAPQNNV